MSRNYRTGEGTPLTPGRGDKNIELRPQQNPRAGSLAGGLSLYIVARISLFGYNAYRMVNDIV